MPIRDQQKVRRAAAAGRFYEGDALSLRRRMAETEAGLPPEVPAGKTVRGCVLPHAGYMFSLGVAMETLRAARHCGCSKVVLLGPSHYVGFRGIAAATFTSWRTPFGDLFAQERNMGRTRALGGECGRQVYDRAANMAFVVAGVLGDIEFYLGRMEFAAAARTHDLVVRNVVPALRKAHMLRMGLALRAPAGQGEHGRSGRRQQVDGRQQQRYAFLHFHPFSIPHSARQPAFPDATVACPPAIRLTPGHFAKV